MQQYSKIGLYGDWDGMTNHIISKYSKYAQTKYKNRHDWVARVIPWEQCKKLKFDHTNKWYKHNQESVLNNETHKLLWNFMIQTDHLIPARPPLSITSIEPAE